MSLADWNDVPEVDRLGMDEDSSDILNVQIPHITIPIRPGRDIARLVEVAAFQSKLKQSGHNAAEELNKRLIAEMSSDVPE